MKNFPPSREELIETFRDLPDFDEQVDYIIDLGRELPVCDGELHRSEHKVEGCMSTVWLNLQIKSLDQPVSLSADSDSQIIKGLLVILLAFYHNKTASEILATDVSDFLRELKLDQHLSPQRRNGLFAMVKRINALALQATSE